MDHFVMTQTSGQHGHPRGIRQGALVVALLLIVSLGLGPGPLGAQTTEGTPKCEPGVLSSVSGLLVQPFYLAAWVAIATPFAIVAGVLHIYGQDEKAQSVWETGAPRTWSWPEFVSCRPGSAAQQ